MGGMNEEEALTLKPGERVLILFKGAWKPATVVEVLYDGAQIRVRPLFLGCRGQRLNHRRRICEEVMRDGSFDFTTANVFADWLEEQGEFTAAHKLRHAFPSCDILKSPSPDSD